ncbi:MAG: hypothetical protein EOM05_12480 [Clostridia bacterium]|nr:hypothetical protein [Clostridia bacterium]
MSWSEIKKAINSDLSEPLNYLHWINDLATFGIDGYVYNQPDKMTELAEKSLNAIFNIVCFDLLINGYADKVFTKLTGDETGAFDGLTTMELIAENSTAMTIVANSETAMTVVANSETAMTAIANSETAMIAIVNSETAMTAIVNSETAMEMVFGVVTPNYSAREAIWDNESASEIIMTNIISREWMVANIQENVEEKTSTPYALKLNKKCLVLAVQRFGTESASESVNYRYIQPGNLASENLTAMTTRIENKRVFPLEMKSGHPNGVYVNIRVYYVQMQE